MERIIKSSPDIAQKVENLETNLGTVDKIDLIIAKRDIDGIAEVLINTEYVRLAFDELYEMLTVDECQKIYDKIKSKIKSEPETKVFSLTYTLLLTKISHIDFDYAVSEAETIFSNKPDKLSFAKRTFIQNEYKHQPIKCFILLLTIKDSEINSNLITKLLINLFADESEELKQEIKSYFQELNLDIDTLFSGFESYFDAFCDPETFQKLGLNQNLNQIFDEARTIIDYLKNPTQYWDINNLALETRISDDEVGVIFKTNEKQVVFDNDLANFIIQDLSKRFQDVDFISDENFSTLEFFLDFESQTDHVNLYINKNEEKYPEEELLKIRKAMNRMYEDPDTLYVNILNNLLITINSDQKYREKFAELNPQIQIVNILNNYLDELDVYKSKNLKISQMFDGFDDEDFDSEHQFLYFKTIFEILKDDIDINDAKELSDIFKSIKKLKSKYDYLKLVFPYMDNQTKYDLFLNYIDDRNTIGYDSDWQNVSEMSIVFFVKLINTLDNVDENFVEDIYGKVKEHENYEIKKCFKLIFEIILQKYFSNELSKNNNLDALELINTKIGKYLEYIYGKISKDKIKQDDGDNSESLEKHIQSFIYNTVYNATRDTKPDYSIILDLISNLSELSSQRKLYIELIERYSNTNGKTLGDLLKTSISETNDLEKKLIYIYKQLDLDKVSLEIKRID